MRSYMEERRACPDQPFGTPKIPNVNTSRVPMISINFQPKFLFIYEWLNLFGFFTRGCDRDDRRPRHIHFQIVRRHAQGDSVILHGKDSALQATTGDHLIARLQRLQHGLPLLLPALLWQDQQEIEDGEDKDERSDTQPAHTTGLQEHGPSQTSNLLDCDQHEDLQNLS